MKQTNQTYLHTLPKDKKTIIDAQNNRLPGDLNIFLSSNKNKTPTMTTPKNKTSEKLNDEVDIKCVKIGVLIHYTVTPEILLKHGE